MGGRVRGVGVMHIRSSEGVCVWGLINWIHRPACKPGIHRSAYKPGTHPLLRTTRYCPHRYEGGLNTHHQLPFCPSPTSPFPPPPAPPKLTRRRPPHQSPAALLPLASLPPPPPLRPPNSREDGLNTHHQLLPRVGGHLLASLDVHLRGRGGGRGGGQRVRV